MPVIYNKFIPFKRFCAMNLFGFIFVRDEYRNMSKKNLEITLNHESIHSAQIKELYCIPFYIWYLIEWVINLFKFKDFHKAYRNISFEREAYAHEREMNYLDSRPRFAFIKH